MRSGVIVSLGFICAPMAFGASIIGIDSEQFARKTQVRVNYDGKIEEPTVFTLSGDRPRLVIDIGQARVNGAITGKTIPARGAAKQIRHAPRESGTRIVIDLAEHAEFSGFIHAGNMTTVNLRLPAGAEIAPQRQSQYSPGGTPIPRVKPPVGEAITARRKRIIVIDPGHGGYDPGALGQAGTKEKDVTLKAAQLLKSEFEKTGRYEVFLTRDRDVYISLETRVKRARRADADLFISLHADSHPKSTTRGASVYTLANHARRRSTNLVKSQNWIMDVDLKETPKAVDDILVDLAQRKTFSNSAKFADILIPELSKVTPVLRNTHRRAGLFVLLAPDVPAVLVEMGFLSNADDEKQLKSASKRKAKAKAIVKATDKYFKQLDAQ